MIFDNVRNALAEQFEIDAETITAETNLIDDLGADSLDLFELVMALEEETGVEIPSEELENIKTIGDVEKYLNA